jgi:hypothetical protein
MVTVSGRRILVIILLALLYSACALANNGLIVESSARQVELGKPFFIDLRTGIQSSPLANIDLTALKSDFFVREIMDVHYDAVNKQQVLRLKVYPRDKGILTIPSLQFAGQSSSPLTIEISSAIDPKTGKPLEVYFSYDNEPLWAKQQWVVTAGIISDAKIVHLESEQPTLQFFDQIALTPGQHSQAGDGKFRHETGWVLFPARAGNFELELPAIKYYRDGVNTHNFYPPHLQVTVRPLPVYIPGTVPVGRLSIRLEGPAQPFMISGDLNHYQLQIIGEGIQLADMPVISLQSLEPSETLHYQYIKEAQQELSTHGLSSKVSYRFPFVTAKTGLVTFAEIRLQYFDPVSGRLHSQTFNPESLVSLPWWLAALLFMLVALTALYIIRLIILFFVNKWRYLKTCRTVLHTIDKSRDCNDYKTALQLFARAEGWQENLSLQQIKRCWARHIQKTGENLAVFDLLMRSLYRGEKIEIEMIRQQLLSLIYARRRLFRFIW